MYSSKFMLRSIRSVHASAVAASAMITLTCLDISITTIPSSDDDERISNTIEANNLFTSIRPFWRSQNVSQLIVPPTTYATKTNRREFLLPTPCNCDNGPIESSSTPRSTMPTTTTLSQPTQPATQPTSPLFQPLTRTTLLLYRLNLKSHSSLPTPRLLTPSDPLFSYPQLTRGIKQRQNDETRLHRLLSSPKAIEARETQDQSKMNALLEEMNALVYGKGVSPQDREDFLMRFGCTGYTSEIMEYLVDDVGKDRGFVEVGAGNGQWARALTDFQGAAADGESWDHSSSSRLRNNNKRNNGKGWEFVLAYDNMQELPLSPQIYHGNTVPAKKYFHDNVRQCASHVDAVQGYPARGRVLLLVYPPPGPMALETVEAYANAHPENDTIVYVGEGLGGANADKKFFEYFLGMNGNDVASERNSKEQQSQLHQKQQQQEQNRNQKQKQTFQWAVVKVMDVLSSPGGKGFEKMFVLKKVACQTVK